MALFHIIFFINSFKNIFYFFQLLKFIPGLLKPAFIGINSRNTINFRTLIAGLGNGFPIEATK
jgi:hypothetical protein